MFTFNFTIPSTFPDFACIQISSGYHIPFVWQTTMSIFCSVGFLQWILILIIWWTLISPSYLKDIFSKSRKFGWQLFVFVTVVTPLPSSLYSIEKSFNSYLCSSVYNTCVFLFLPPRFSLFLFKRLEYDVSCYIYLCFFLFLLVLLGVLWTFCIWSLMYFIIYGKSPVITSLDISSFLFYFCSPSGILFASMLA